jgi:hypothetical protein
MASIEEMAKGLVAVKALMNEMLTLGEDAIAFVMEKNMWDDFMKFHTNKDIERRAKDGPKV